MRYLRRATLLAFTLVGLQICPNGAAFGDPQAPAKPAQSHPASLLQGAIDAAMTGDDAKFKDYCLKRNARDIATSESDPKPTLISGLKRAHKLSLQLCKEKDYQKASNVLMQVFLVFMVCSPPSPDADRSLPAAFYFVDACHRLGISKKDFIAPLNDYAYYEQLAGNDEHAITIFKKVIAEYPEREVAYLNLADSLWKTGKEDEARPLYDKYQKLMVAENLAAKIPAEAKNRMSGTASVASSAYDTDADRERYGPYMQEVQLRVHEAWNAPTVSRVPGKVVICFQVNAEGKISDIKLTKASGVAELDQSCLRAANAAKLPPLPEHFARPTEVEFVFSYNLDNAADPKEQLISRWERKVKEADSPDNLIGLGQALQSAKHYTRAEITYRKAVAMKPDNTYYKKLLDDCTTIEKSHMFKKDPASAMK